MLTCIMAVKRLLLLLIPCIWLAVSVLLPVSFAMQPTHVRLRQNIRRWWHMQTDQQQYSRRRSSNGKVVDVSWTVVISIRLCNSETASQHRLWHMYVPNLVTSSIVSLKRGSQALWPCGQWLHCAAKHATSWLRVQYPNHYSSTMSQQTFGSLAADSYLQF